jgi:hypothetical protein
MRSRSLAVPAAAVLAFLVSPADAGGADGFRKTETYDEVLAFLTRLERLSPYLRVSFIGPSEQGRRIPVVVASKEKLFEPAKRFKSPKPVVLVTRETR